MKGLREKLHSNKGFTLIEMLIVVAIIAILISISIPVVNQALESAREATDAANERSFKAELMLRYLMGTVDDSSDFVTHNSPKYAYNAQTGKIQLITDDVVDMTPYGKGRANAGKDTEKKDGMILYGGVTDDGDVIMGWGTPANKGMSTKNLTSEALNKK